MSDDRSAALKEAEARFRSIEGSALDAIITIDEFSIVISWNRGAEQIFGYTADEMIDQSIVRIIPERFRAKHYTGVERHSRTGESSVIGTLSELEGMRKDGTLFPAELTLQSWTSEGRPYYSGIIRDVTARKEDERRRKEQLRQKAENERHRSISYMVVGIAHEFNTPLGIINQAATIILDTLSEENLPNLADNKESIEDLVEAAALIRHSARRASRLVQSFKNLSTHQMSDEQQRVDMRDVVQEAIAMYEYKEKQSNLDIQVQDNLGERERDWVGYPSHLTQVIINLLSNAERCAYPGGAGGRVDLVLSPIDETDPRCQQPSFELIVRDHGCGIDAEHLDQIFTPFFTIVHSKGGNGLGMAIVYNLVTSALCGTIDVESTLGEGTSVIITTPRTLPH